MNLAELIGSIGFEVDEKPLEAVNQRLEGIQRRLEFLGAAEVLKGIFELTERFSGFAEQLGTAAASAGLTAEALQKLQFAAGQSGVSADEVSGGMARLTRSLYEARQGSAEAKKQFEDVGIPESQIATFHTGSDALAAVADAMARIDDPIKKQALAMQLLGRGSSNMVEFLSKGSAAMREAGASAKQMGAVVSNRDVESLRQVEDSLSALWQTVKAFSASVAAMFAPSVRDAVAVLMRFYAANRQLIMVNIHKWVYDGMFALGYLVGVIKNVIQYFFDFAAAHPVLVKRVGEFAVALFALSITLMGVAKVLSAVKGGMSLLGDGMSALGKPVNFLWGALGLLKNGLVLIIGRVGLLVSTLLPGLGTWIVSIATALNATPLGLIVAGVAALALGINLIWTILKGGKFEDTWLGKLVAGVKGFGRGILAKFGIDVGGSADASQTESSAKKAAAAAPMPDAQSGIMQRLSGLFGGQDPVAAMQKIDGVGAGMSTLLPGASALRAAAQSEAQKLPETPAMAQSYQVNAPVTINVPQGSDPQTVAQKVKDGITAHLDRVYRDAHRSVRSPQEY